MRAAILAVVITLWTAFAFGQCPAPGSSNWCSGTYQYDAAGNITGYGNLYGNLLDYVISAALIFYILTIAGIFRLRQTRPNAERPYKAFGYPIVPILYMIGASVILIVLFVYQTATTWPGLIIVLTGIPVYFLWKKIGVPMDAPSGTLAEEEV